MLDQATQEERTAGLPPSTAEYLDTVRACLDSENQAGRSNIYRTVAHNLAQTPERAEGEQLNRDRTISIGDLLRAVYGLGAKRSCNLLAHRLDARV